MPPRLPPRSLLLSTESTGLSERLFRFAASCTRNQGTPRFSFVHLLDLLQWPAMVVTALAAWFVGNQSKRGRSIGFWLFLVSNVLWIIWGWHDHAYALITLQIALAVINIRGAEKNDPSRGR